MFWKQISAGGWHSGALSVSGDIYLWGDKDVVCGNIESGDHIPKILKLKNNDLKFKRISCGYNHCLAISENGQIYQWGKSFR